jgi:sterol desaturase/sphingolipid hydroxylase (fatty acid hydroxylase superfamily)
MSDPHDESLKSLQPIRLFPSDRLEFFTHIHPAVVPAIWLPVAAIFLARGVLLTRAAGHGWAAVPAFFGGIILWSFAEYCLHRFIFHFTPRTPAQKRIAFLMHGVHHAQPRVKTRLVMPPLVSVPLACFFYALFTLVVSMLFRAPDLTGALFAGFVVGYVCYDLLHYSLHHVQFRNGFMKALRSHHMRHHTEYDSRFGVSTPLWDHVFQTEPRKDSSASGGATTPHG